MRREWKPESWEVAKTTLVAAPVKPSVESQMNALLGGRLFRERTRMVRLPEVRAIAPRRQRRTVLLSLFVASFALGLAGAGAIAHGANQSRRCAALVRELEGFLRTGALREADETLDRVRVLAGAAGRSRALAPLMARAEATLFHFVDASEERRQAVEALLDAGGEGTFDGVVARALLTPPEDLGELQPVLEAIANEKRDPEAAFLVALSLAARGREEAADRAFEQAIDLEPSHLPHLAHHARWLARTGRTVESGEVLDQMRNIDPESPWIEWVEGHAW